MNKNLLTLSKSEVIGSSIGMGIVGFCFGIGLMGLRSDHGPHKGLC